MHEYSSTTLVPAFQPDFWSAYTLHLISSYISILCFAFTFASGLTFIIYKRFAAVFTKSFNIGFVFFTISIVSGSVWANYAWGTYWSWDPKETLSLFSWLAGTVWLYLRYGRGLFGRRMVWAVVIGIVISRILYFVLARSLASW
ncbi:cytochrome c biogenesis protein CcsA [Thermodesulfobacteriota bacterium]